ncbi:MAG TPA: hypothetical protein VFT50_09785 [Baekduia sp.]|nr:hypothetical protein [Baekduia sp.]
MLQTPTIRVGRTRLRAAAVLAAVAAAVPVVAGAPATAGAAQPTAHAAKSCSTPKYPGVGYFTSLSVRHTSCGVGRKVMLGYYKCRVKHGKAGTCKSRVRGFKCREKRNAIPTEIDARVTCKRGHKVVKHTYQQDL